MSSAADLLALPLSPELVFRWVLRLCGVSVAISTLELLARSALFGSSGCLSWSLGREFYAFETPRWLEPFLGASAIRSVLFVRLAACCGLLLSVRPSMLAPCVLVLAASSLLLTFRMPVGRDGSDQMNDLILVPAGLAMLWDGEGAKSAALFFIAAQASLAYATAGFAKLVSPVWRSGQALPQILSTLSHGHSLAGKTLRSSRVLALLACWGIMLFETCFSLWLLMGPRGTLAVLAVGIAFHLGCAVLMGLNCFLWSFLAAYPAILLASARLGPLVHLGGGR